MRQVPVVGWHTLFLPAALPVTSLRFLGSWVAVNLHSRSISYRCARAGAALGATSSKAGEQVHVTPPPGQVGPMRHPYCPGAPCEGILDDGRRAFPAEAGREAEGAQQGQGIWGWLSVTPEAGPSVLC